MEDRSPPWLIDIAIEPKTQADTPRLSAALREMDERYPDFETAWDAESGQIILRGRHEGDLDARIDRLRDTYGLDVNVGALQVAYRETITRNATIDYTHKKLIGGGGQFARVEIAFEPIAHDAPFIFENAAGDAVPDRFVPGVERGLRAQKDSGLLAGFPLIGLKATLIDGAWHDRDSDARIFEIATRAALRKLAEEAGPVLLEPIMSIEISAPADALEAIAADLARRRGTIANRNASHVSGRVPLASVFGYPAALRRLSAGRARYGLHFHAYAPVPPNLYDGDDPGFRPAIGMRVG